MGTRNVVIANASRTPVGSFMGTLASLPAAKLAAIAIKDVLKKTNVGGDKVDEVIMGNVLQGGQGQAPARQACLFAGLPDKVECLTIHKVCGSGLKSVMLAAQAIAAGDAEIIVAGGMENMSLAPYVLAKARDGYRLGNGEIIDLMVKDGLWDVYNNIHMGNCAEACAKKMNITREEQDAYAIESYRRAIKAQEQGLFKNEIAPVEIPSKKETILFVDDEEPKKVMFDKIPTLKPAFDKEGTITAANASKINDGAAAILVMSEEKANELNIKPMALIKGHCAAARAPIEFPLAPADAVRKLMKKLNMTTNDIDLWELNEAFSCVALGAIKDLELDPAKVNVNGGAVAIGHPIGASGGRILATLLNAMKQRNAKYGLASLCLGGGEAVALVVENI
ncbi:MAG: acetyl-CoA acetyltransferase [Candidatus Fischerbacteria bacterium RBG_13_37_8]|uniref:acetyl-CoA C-acetyltransferase n=1 Tax=Candidatus Fischerbacteria bacterium RBG_13_37_8 TaxID=1817863 RepID=A0A1F5VX72_9BACT|nr:MAG: acetyl-CoA acetyltransferase [Candidatus Fischerbacteria bacterium RBG_13_37_8]